MLRQLHATNVPLYEIQVESFLIATQSRNAKDIRLEHVEEYDRFEDALNHQYRKEGYELEFTI